jgi:glycosyltransferase involved in cell wall biosynthesis
MDIQVTFVCARTEMIDYHADSLQQLGIEVLTGPRHARANLRALGDTIQAVIVERPEIGVFYLPLLRSLLPRTPIIYDSVDLHFLRLWRSAQLKGDDDSLKAARRYALIESELTRLADSTIAITRDEKEILEHMVPGARIEVIPNIHDVTSVDVPFAERKGLLFIANFNHPPNIDSLRYLLDAIWPSIRSAMPESALTVVGQGVEESDLPVPLPQGVEIAGWVRDIEPLIDHARVLVAPLRYGAGMKGKITQSMSRGLPVVTTSMGVEGMDVVSGSDLYVADAPEEFAQAVVRLHEDEETWREISGTSKAFIGRTCSPQQAREVFASLLSTAQSQTADNDFLFSDPQ